MTMVRWGLLRMYWRKCMPLTFLCTVGMGLLAVLWPDVLMTDNLWVAVLIFVHCLMLGVMLGRTDQPDFAFLYTRGYTRDTIWLQMMLASALSGLAPLLVGSLILWTGLRSTFQNHVMENPFFPIMAPREQWMPMIWLLLYLLLIPASHYAWIRRNLPTRSSQGGYYVVIGLLVAILVGFYMEPRLDGWLVWMAGTAYIITLVAMLAGGWILHRSVEVRS